MRSPVKFSEIKEDEWDKLRPYMDTCLLPLTGLTGEESPWQAARALEKLRDAMADLEKRYFGRVVTYPAYHYGNGDFPDKPLARLTERLKASGFRYVICITADERLSGVTFPEADLFLTPRQAEEGTAVQAVSELWKPPAASG